MFRYGSLAIIPLLFMLDQISKWWIIEMFFRPRVFDAAGNTMGFMEWFISLEQERFPPAQYEINSIFNLVMVWNNGISFGMFGSDHDAMKYILGGSAILLVGGLLVWLWRSKSWTTSVPLAVVIAGAIANVWDRVRFGAVADFLDFHIGDMHYPAFNLADSCIVLGVAALALDGIILESRRTKKNQPLAAGGE